MVKTYKPRVFKSTRLCVECGLVFLLLSILSSCRQPAPQKLSILYHNKYPIAIKLPDYLFDNRDADDVKKSIKVVLQGSGNQNGILGNIDKYEEHYSFFPLIALTPGLTFQVWQNDRLVGKLEVPFDKTLQPTTLLWTYPTYDTVPENLLKIYLFFSNPVRTGQSLQYVALLDKNRDTMRNVFLDLQPELWNQSSTMLTLWLDPGRIKRGLVLNQKLGNPLKKNESYELVVSGKWKDTRGKNVIIKGTKKFFVGERDEKSPDINDWQFTPPKAGTTGLFTCRFREKLDQQLLPECLNILDENNQTIYGTSQGDAESRVWQFMPDKPWKTGTYKLRVRATLEDLAGNNLNRVFDRDITKDKQQRNQEYYYRTFVVK